MKLSLCALLVALAIYCYQADAAIICPALAGELTAFVAGTEDAYRLYIAQFNAPEAVVEDKMRPKVCLDESVPAEGRARIGRFLANVVAACKNEL
ncbi:secretoglobin family 1D member 2-like [Sorex araneus]|uniref:secretoglobin family 1D member 2-like n=1 Tax=Sorex araneus TaxID=42254 RepID=UPI002433C005|nr:secretoglobin family 1D member 2-like [Sorex araneus]